MNEMKRTEKLFLNRRNFLTIGAIAVGVATASSIIPEAFPWPLDRTPSKIGGALIKATWRS